MPDTVTMLSSVRIRLTLWYSGAMAVTLLVLASATYFVLRENLGKRVDAQCVELADTFLSTVNAEMGDATKPDSLADGVSAAISEHRFRDVTFAVFDPRGNLIGMSESAPEDRHHGPWKPEEVLPALKSPPRGVGPFSFCARGGTPFPRLRATFLS